MYPTISTIPGRVTIPDIQYVEILLDSPTAPLEQAYLTYKLGD